MRPTLGASAQDGQVDVSTAGDPVSRSHHTANRDRHRPQPPGAADKPRPGRVGSERGYTCHCGSAKCRRTGDAPVDPERVAELLAADEARRRETERMCCRVTAVRLRLCSSCRMAAVRGVVTGSEAGPGGEGGLCPLRPTPCPARGTLISRRSGGRMARLAALIHPRGAKPLAQRTARLGSAVVLRICVCICARGSTLPPSLLWLACGSLRVNLLGLRRAPPSDGLNPSAQSRATPFCLSGPRAGDLASRQLGWERTRGAHHQIELTGRCEARPIASVQTAEFRPQAVLQSPRGGQGGGWLADGGFSPERHCGIRLAPAQLSTPPFRPLSP
ncbi:hypothetical protein AAFF_G00263160 [Aldrovandia affinis]|uniref:Uncharacterized protein n=1 Tax=Aldrovandia affinis TaxID=143900 RepID=A0AAD7WT61_9TELE|nr:hypothetical protein AAFF_G00263160 [Aldrovandia affinis]